MKDLIKRQIGYCETCKGIFNTHENTQHILRIMKDIQMAQREMGNLWQLRFNIPVLKKEFDKFNK